MKNIKIGEFLRQLRNEKEMTQEMLAEELNVTNKTISRWENGTHLPPVHMLVSLGNYFDVSINEILNGERIDNVELKTKADEVIISLKEKNDLLARNIGSIVMMIVTVLINVILMVVCFFKDDSLLGVISVSLSIIMCSYLASYYFMKNKQEKKAYFKIFLIEVIALCIAFIGFIINVIVLFL